MQSVDALWKHALLSAELMKVQELRKAPMKRRRKSRRGKARVDPLTSAEEADLFSRQQVLHVWICLPTTYTQSATRLSLHYSKGLSSEGSFPAIAGIDNQVATVAEQQSRCIGWTFGR